MLRSKTIHTIRCDEGECRNRVKIEKRGRQAAVTQARRDGWSAYDGKHFCPLHNTKDTPKCPACGSWSIKVHFYRDSARCRECGVDMEWPNA